MKSVVSGVLVLALLWTIVPESAGDLPAYNDGTTGTINVGNINVRTNVNAAAGAFTNSLTLNGSAVLTNVSAASVTSQQTNVASANPSATIGGTVQNGSALTFMRSDSVPALSSTVVLTNGSTGTPLTVNGNSANTWLLNLSVGGTSAGGWTNNGQLLLQSGTSASPSVGWAADADGTGTGIYRPSPSAIGFSINGTEQIEMNGADIYLTTAGARVIIGTGSAATAVTLERDGAAGVLQIESDAASPTSAVVKGADGSGTDKIGASLTVEGGQSTGAGVPGDVIYRTSLYTNSSGSTANAFTTRGQIIGRPCALTNATATSFQRFTMATNTQAGIKLFATVTATDASFNKQSISSDVRVDAVNVSGTITATASETDNTLAANTGTLTIAYTVVDEGSNVLAIRANANSSLTTPTVKIKWVIQSINSDGAITVTPVQL